MFKQRKAIMYKYFVVFAPVHWFGWFCGVFFRLLYTGFIDGYFYVEDESLLEALQKKHGISRLDAEDMLIKRS